MDENKILREQLVNLLIKNQAHMSYEEMVKDFPMNKINMLFPNGEYSAYGLLEHLRRVQSDILEFMTADKYMDKDWPKDYWPDKDFQASSENWKETIKLFLDDQNKLVDIVHNPKTDLFEKVKNGTGQNILREILVIADHNAYHTGEFAIMRQVMGTWKR